MKKAIKKRIIPKKKAASRKAKLKTKVGGKKTIRRKRVRSEHQSVDTVAFALEGLAARSGGQSGDLQGLSNVQGADSESVDELLEEGNAFEADAVKGVEDAEDADAEEARTHQVPQDDVPREYLHRKK
jgi:N utilization substance protein A